MTVLFPGTVAGYLPYRMLAPVRVPSPAEWRWSHYLGGLAVGVGLTVLLTCIWAFAYHGKGTLAPFDEPRKLVVRGMYRYARNPMYVGLVMILLGEASFFRSSVILMYAGLVFVIANIVIIGYEEPRLRSNFGDDYEHYRRRVSRWIPGRPYQ